MFPEFDEIARDSNTSLPESELTSGRTHPEPGDSSREPDASPLPPFDGGHRTPYLCSRCKAGGLVMAEGTLRAIPTAWTRDADEAGFLDPWEGQLRFCCLLLCSNPRCEDIFVCAGTMDQDGPTYYEQETWDTSYRPTILSSLGGGHEPMKQGVLSEPDAGTSPSPTSKPVARNPSDDLVEKLVIEFPSNDRALVTEGRSVVEIRGERRVWLFRKVVDADGQTVRWKDLVETDIRRASELVREGDPESTNPRMATNGESFQRTGNRIRKDLRKLAYHWEQDGHGARWSSHVS